MATTFVYQKEIDNDPVHLPDKVLEPGTYEWDVIALDENRKSFANRGKKKFTILENAIKLPWIDPDTLLNQVHQEHPRILYPKAKLSEIRSSLQSTRRRSWQGCLAAAEKALHTSVPKFPEYHLIEDRTKSRLAYVDYFRYFRGFINGALMDLSLAFLLAEENKYAEAAKRILLEVASWPTDDDDVTSVSAKWGDEAGLSFAKCAHKVYDWLYPALSTEEKKLVFKMCEDRAWQVYRRLKERKNYLTYPGESHDGRLIAYLSDMAIALAHESEGPRIWLEYSLKAMTTFYPHWAGIDGGWAEGTAYGLWYNTYYIPGFMALKYHTGYDLWQRPFFKNLRYFFFYCTALRGKIRPFGDSAETGGPGVSGGSGYADLMWLHAHQYKDPNIGWWVNQIKGWNGSRGETALLFEDNPPAKKPTNMPNSKVFNSIGWAGLHSDITDPDNDTCLIFKSSPYGSVSHSHADQNSFAIMKGGKALAIPSGYYGPAYGQPHHAKWTRSTKANNCILVNGEGQVIREAKDAAAAYMGNMKKFIRHILFLRPGIFLLLDELEAPQNSKFQWMLHAFDKMLLKDSKILSRRDNTSLEINLHCPLGLTIKQTDQFDTPFNEGIPEEYHGEKKNQWHITAETRDMANKTIIAAFMVVTGPEETVEVNLKEMDGWVGLQAEGKFGLAKGWIKLVEGKKGPEGFGDEVLAGNSKLCGQDRDGELFVV
jgi:hypothetical protein